MLQEGGKVHSNENTVRFQILMFSSIKSLSLISRRLLKLLFIR